MTLLTFLTRASSEPTLRVLDQTTSSITLGWDAIPNAVGYRFQSSASAPKWSHTFNGSRTSVKFGKADWYVVEPLHVSQTLTYP